MASKSTFSLLNAKVIQSYDGKGFVRTDSDLTWKATKKGQHEQSDGSTVSTGLTGVDNVVAQACYYSDMESGLTGAGEIATLGTNRGHTVNLHSSYGFCHTWIGIVGVKTSDSGTARDLSYYTNRDGVVFEVNRKNVYSNGNSTIRWGYNANSLSAYPNMGGAIRSNGTWNNQSDTAEHPIGNPHGSIGGITFLPQDFTWTIAEPGFYLMELDWVLIAASAPVTDVKWLIKDSLGEVLGGGQTLLPGILLTTFGTHFPTILYIPEANTKIKVNVVFEGISREFNLDLHVLIQKIQTLDSNPVDAAT